MGEHREYFRLEFQYGAVEDLYGNDHGLARPHQSLVVKNAKPSAGIKGLLFQLVKFNSSVSSWGDCRILFDLGDPRAVDRRNAADIHKRLNVRIAPPARKEGLYNAFLLGCEAAFPFSYSHVGGNSPLVSVIASRKWEASTMPTRALTGE